MCSFFLTFPSGEPVLWPSEAQPLCPVRSNSEGFKADDADFSPGTESRDQPKFCSCEWTQHPSKYSFPSICLLNVKFIFSSISCNRLFSQVTFRHWHHYSSDGTFTTRQQCHFKFILKKIIFYLHIIKSAYPHLHIDAPDNYSLISCTFFFPKHPSVFRRRFFSSFLDSLHHTQKKPGPSGGTAFDQDSFQTGWKVFPAGTATNPVKTVIRGVLKIIADIVKISIFLSQYIALSDYSSFWLRLLESTRKKNWAICKGCFCGLAIPFLIQVQTFESLLKSGKLKPSEQMKVTRVNRLELRSIILQKGLSKWPPPVPTNYYLLLQGLSQLAQGLDSLERAYLIARDEHRVLEHRGAEVGPFDPNRWEWFPG